MAHPFHLPVRLPHRRPVGHGGPSGLLLGAACDVAVAAAALLAVVGAAAAQLGAGYAARVLLFFVAGAALVWRGLNTGNHPHPRFGTANRITLARLGLVALMAGLVDGSGAFLPRSGPWAWGLVALATGTALLDAVDGWLARRSGLASAFGARFDLETDAAYTLVLCMLVWQAGQAGLWVLAGGLLRYAWVAAAWRCAWPTAALPASRRRQAIGTTQIVTLIVCLAPVVPPVLAAELAAASLALLVASFAADARLLARERRP